MRKILVRRGLGTTENIFTIKSQHLGEFIANFKHSYSPKCESSIKTHELSKLGNIVCPSPNPGLRAMTGHRVRSYTLQNMSFMIKVDQRHGGHLILCPHPSKM